MHRRRAMTDPHPLGTDAEVVLHYEKESLSDFWRGVRAEIEATNKRGIRCDACWSRVYWRDGEISGHRWFCVAHVVLWLARRLGWRAP